MKHSLEVIGNLNSKSNVVKEGELIRIVDLPLLIAAESHTS